MRDILILKSFFILLLFSLSPLSSNAQDGFSVNISSGCSPLVVNFTYTAGGSPTNLTWNFGNSTILNGNPSVDPVLLNPSISYIPSGSYTVSLTVTTSSGTTTYTSTNLITVFEDPSPNFIANVTEGCGSFPVSFNDLSVPGDGAITQWNWDFGDAGSSNLQNPTHFYNTPGIYDVSLSVTDENGCNSIFSIQNYITAIDGVYPEFEIDPTVACDIPTLVTITNLSSGAGDLTYFWNFGNATNSSLENPLPVSYSTYGFFPITLTLSNDLGCTQYATQLVTIQEYSVDFDAYLNCLPAPSLFSNTSDPEMNVFSWDFGDPASGSANTSNESVPAHVFSGPGSYTVTLTASIDGICESSTTQQVNILEAEAVQFEASPTFICELPTELPILVTNDNVESYSWFVSMSGQDLFDSGNQTNNTLDFSVNNAPVNEGNYNLTLSVTFENGCSSFLQFNNYFTVDTIKLNTIVEPYLLCEGDSVIGSDLTTFSGGIESYEWDWGDNSFSTGPNAQHIYNESGNYDLLFTVTSTQGCSQDTLINIQVGTLTDPSFTYPDTTVCIEESVQFFYTGDPSIVDGYIWAYNGIFTSSSQNPFIEINDIDSIHLVTLTTLNNGCIDTTFLYVNITGLGPKAKFIADEGFYCKEEDPWFCTITNNSDSTENTIYQWSFADDYLDSTTVTDPGTVEFLDFGPHGITLVATDTLTGCSTDQTQYVNIDNFNIFFKNPASDACDTLLYIGQTLFTDTFFVDEDKLIYYWNFGTGIADTGITSMPLTPTIEYLYDTPGDYIITVYATNEYGCSDTISKVISIHPHPIAQFDFDDSSLCPPFYLQIENQSIEMDTAITEYEYTLTTQDTLFFYEENPNLYIESPQPYGLSLHITDGFGCVDSIMEFILPHMNLIDFFLPDYLCYNTDYEIINNSEGEFMPLSFLWEFGDGTTSTETNPIINIDESQNDTLLNFLTITDNTGCTQVDSFYIYISIPTLSYTFEIDEAACPPMYSDFGIFSPNTIDLFNIDYGDGESNSVNTQFEAANISHVYDTPGIYGVIFSVTDENGCSASIEVDSLVFVPGPWAAFSFSPNSGCPPLEVDFEILEQSNVESYFWVFGDGYTSNLENPTHIYTYAGTFTPILVIQDSLNLAGGDSIPCIISIQGENVIIDGPILDFFVVDDTLCYGEGIPMEIQNQTQSIPGFEIISYLWDFGDESTSTDENPLPHLYTDPGFYSITLTVVTSNGCEYTLQKVNAFYLMPAPLLNPYIQYEASCPPMMVDFYGDSSGIDDPYVHYLWDFDDGSFSNEFETSHLYQIEGPFDPSLEIDYYGCTFSGYLNETIQSFSVPEAIISAAPQFSNNVLSDISLNNVSIDDDHIEWWMNGQIISTQDELTVNAQDENLIVSLVAFSEDGCSDTSWFWLSDYNWVIPNIITPNGDGFNDFFVLNFSDFGPCIDVKIFDRWGLKIYENSNYMDDWDGKNMKGQNVSDGTYFYLISICGNSQISGYVTVIH